MPRLPSLNALRCFEAAARSGSFSRAAVELNVTQSAVSHQIRQLEQWFGATLFERQGRQTVPTARGEELARSLAEAFDIMAVACKRLVESRAGPQLTIASLPSIATFWLIPRLSKFIADHPEIAVKVVYAFHGQRIDFNGCDIAILWGRGDWEDCQITRFLDGDTVAVCNPIYLEREGPFATPRDLIGKPLLHDTNRADWQAWMRAALIRSPEPAPGPVYEDFNLLRAAALAGQGIALCPRAAISDDFAAGRLVQLFDVAIKQDHGYHMLEPSGSERRSEANTLFRAWLVQEGKAQIPARDTVQT
jgi:LysR family glycine cleavage system transcriptional activator